MDAALAGLLGTAVGAVTGLGGSFLTSERSRSAERQAWRRTTVEESYTQCIRSLLQTLDMRSELHVSGAEGRVTAVLSLEDQPKYLAAMVDARFWLSVVLMYATAESRDKLRRHESALASAVDGFLGGAEQEGGDLHEVMRQTLRGLWTPHAATLVRCDSEGFSPGLGHGKNLNRRSVAPSLLPRSGCTSRSRISRGVTGDSPNCCVQGDVARWLVTEPSRWRSLTGHHGSVLATVACAGTSGMIRG
jgi:hypothetical protein